MIMYTTVRNATAGIQNRGYDMSHGSGVDQLEAYLRGLMPDMLDWSYDCMSGDLTIRRQVTIPTVPDELNALGIVEERFE